MGVRVTRRRTRATDENSSVPNGENSQLLDRWNSATPDIKGKIVGELMDVVVMPAPQGVRTFDPDLIEIRWH